MFKTDRRYPIPNQSDNLKISLKYLTDTFEMIENDLDDIFIRVLVKNDNVSKYH